MFDIGWIEMAVIALVVIIFIGPKELPTVLRTLGQWVSKARAMAREFQEGLEDMARESGLDETRREIESATGDIGGKIEKAIDPDAELKDAFDPDRPLADERKGDAPPSDKAGTTEAPRPGIDEDAGAEAQKPAQTEKPKDEEPSADERSVPAKGGG